MPVTRKIETEDSLKLNYRIYVDNIDFVLDKKKCKKCDICAVVCPKEAITVGWVKNEDTGVDELKFQIDENKCVFCEVCAAFCPSNAISLFYNGEPKRILRENKGLPELLDKFSVDATKCPKDCVACEKACPTGAVKVPAPNKVEFFDEKCLRCPSCELVCPVGTIHVKPMLLGTISVNPEICKKSCKSLAETQAGTARAPACAEACPTKAITYDQKTGRVNVDSRICIYCGACTNACRDEGAISMKRTRVARKHSDDSFSSAWDFSVQKLAGAQASFVDHEERVRNRIVSMLGEEEGVIE